MKLSIKPALKNKYTKSALLIKGAAPVLWFRELEALDISIQDIEAYAIPSDKANVLYGCLLIFNKELPKDTRNHIPFQCAYNKLFIPEYTTLYPQLTASDIAGVKASWIIAHPDFGFVDLEERVDWLSLMAEVPPAERQVYQPIEGIVVPDKILSYSVEMDEEALQQALLPQKTEEAWMKELPFDLQKVLSGNKKEVEKYLKYLEKYPERALALGVPLDVMNTSRDSGWASFNFKSGWLQSLFAAKGGFGSGGGGGGTFGGNFGSGRRGAPFLRYLRYAFLIFMLITLLGRLLNSKDKEIAYVAPETLKAKMSQAGTDMANETAPASTDSIAVYMEKDTVSAIQRAQLLSRHFAAIKTYGSEEVQSDKQLNDSMRLKMQEIKKQMNALELEIAARKDSLKEAFNTKLETELLATEKKISRKIKDSLTALPEAQKESSGSGKALYDAILKDKKTYVRDSLEKAYGLSTRAATVPPDPQLQPAAEAAPAPHAPGILTQIILLTIGLIIGVFIFAKVIRGKTISMGGGQLNGGVKVLLLLIFVAMLAYILYPLIGRYGYNWFVNLIFVVAAALLYRLLVADKTILKSDKNE